MIDDPSALDRQEALSADDLLAGSGVVHEIHVPLEILRPRDEARRDAPRKVYLRPLSVATVALISRASQDDASLVPLLMIKESLVDPQLTLEQIRGMHVGLVQFLVSRINQVSGLGVDGDALGDWIDSPLSRTHILLAKHFGWTPEQVSQLTPGQVAVYLAGIDRLMESEEQRNVARSLRQSV